jgi:hypothetical protein
VAQDEELVTYAKKITKKDLIIDWKNQQRNSPGKSKPFYKQNACENSNTRMGGNPDLRFPLIKRNHANCPVKIVLQSGSGIPVHVVFLHSDQFSHATRPRQPRIFIA